jgi:CspA family cold shock protein
MTGTIKTLTDRGFGFISREGEAKDLFFHSKDLVGITFDELRQGDTVNFEVAEGPKGPNAVNVSRA